MNPLLQVLLLLFISLSKHNLMQPGGARCKFGSKRPHELEHLSDEPAAPEIHPASRLSSDSFYQYLLTG